MVPIALIVLYVHSSMQAFAWTVLPILPGLILAAFGFFSKSYRWQCRGAFEIYFLLLYGYFLAMGARSDVFVPFPVPPNLWQPQAKVYYASQLLLFLSLVCFVVFAILWARSRDRARSSSKAR
jgi:hypothetical protein